jgi:hypothetical protein
MEPVAGALRDSLSSPACKWLISLSEKEKPSELEGMPLLMPLPLPLAPSRPPEASDPSSRERADVRSTRLAADASSEGVPTPEPHQNRKPMAISPLGPSTSPTSTPALLFPTKKSSKSLSKDGVSVWSTRRNQRENEKKKRAKIYRYAVKQKAYTKEYKSI